MPTEKHLFEETKHIYLIDLSTKGFFNQPRITVILFNRIEEGTRKITEYKTKGNKKRRKKAT